MTTSQQSPRAKPSAPMGIGEALGASAWLSDAIIERLSDRAEVTVREKFAVAQFSLSLDHREAVVLLVMSGAYPSAMTLARPVVEAFIRGLWAESIANDQQLLDFVRDRYDPKMDAVVRALRKSANPMADMLGALQARFSTLHDYAHGGPRQISRWLQVDSVAPVYPPQQMIELLRVVDLVGCLAAAGRERKSGRNDAPLLELFRQVLAGSYYGNQPAPRAVQSS